MKRAIIRSTVFNILFYISTALACVICLPMLVLPRRFFMGVVYFFVHMVWFWERTVLGLKLEVRGLEHLPKDGSYIVASKHQSAYETMKLHILFGDPAVILKKELLSIPLWGLYLKKSDPIAIDRSSPDAAIESIKSGAQRMKEQGRPIVIFPQGTRVATDISAQNKPYKIGVARIQDATGLPIIPMALNAGLFWPKHGWLKSSGNVIFEFLEPIPAGMNKDDLMSELTEKTEDATQSLMNEAKEQGLNKGFKKIGIVGIAFLVALIFGAYSFLWFGVAEQVKREYPLVLEGLTDAENPPKAPEVSGYPGKIHVSIPTETLQTPDGRVTVQNFKANSWPVPGVPTRISTDNIEVKNFKWISPLVFTSLDAVLKYHKDILTIYESALSLDDFTLSVTGDADLSQQPFPALNLNLRLENHQTLVRELLTGGVIDQRMALFLGAGLTGLADEDGIVNLPLNQKGRILYAGPLPIMTLPHEVPSAQTLKRQQATPSPEPTPVTSDAPSVQDSESLPAPSP